MLPKGKSRIETILLKMKDGKDKEKAEPSEDAADESEGSSSASPGMVTAMEEFHTALEDGDASAMADALKSFFDMCKSCEDE